MTKIKLPTKSASRNGKSDSKLPGKQVYQQIKEKYVAFKGKIMQINELQRDAFDRMYEFGELLLDHEAEIKQDYGTWGRFADEQGMSASTISRCKASVADFRMHGAKTLEQARDLLKKRDMLPSAKLMESNINRLLTDSDDAGQKKTPHKKSVRHDNHINELHNMSERAEEIISQHEPDDEIYQEALHLQEFVKETIDHLESLDISQKKWNNRSYLNFCRKICYDVVLGEPVDQTEPMHISPNGDVGSMGGKVADFYAIPGCRDTHNKLDGDELNPSKDEIAHWHRWTLINFLFHTIASDNVQNLEEAEYNEV